MFFEDNELNNIIVSIIWGFGVACLFKKICHTKNCIVIKAPKNNNMIYDNNRCFQLEKEIVNCQ